jgi:hypothetical protein
MWVLIWILNAMGWLWLAFAVIGFLTALNRELTGRTRYYDRYSHVASWVAPPILLAMSLGMWRIARALG